MRTDADRINWAIAEGERLLALSKQDWQSACDCTRTALGGHPPSCASWEFGEAIDAAKKAVVRAGINDSEVALAKALSGYVEVSDASGGVEGWHLNGDIASWAELNITEAADEVLLTYTAKIESVSKEA